MVATRIGLAGFLVVVRLSLPFGNPLVDMHMRNSHPTTAVSVRAPAARTRVGRLLRSPWTIGSLLRPSGALLSPSSPPAGSFAATSAAAAAKAQLAEEARKQAFVLINRGIDRAMPRLQSFARQQLLDPDMPRPAVRGLDALLDASMVELREVLTEALTETVLQQQPAPSLPAAAEVSYRTC